MSIKPIIMTHRPGEANEMAELMRRHGSFEPHSLPLEEMEYTTMPSGNGGT